MRDKVRYKRQI